MTCVFLNRKQVLATHLDAEKDGVTVPTTLSEYCIASKPRPSESITDIDYYDDDYMDDNDMDDDDDDDCYDDEGDSGHGDV